METVTGDCYERNSNKSLRVKGLWRYTTMLGVEREERGLEEMRTIVLLSISNIFMTFAWYGHLRFRSEALWKVIVASWGIAFFEYCFQVPANRFGSYEFNPAQLKTIQEIITLSIFPVFSIFYLGDRFKWNYGVGFVLIVAAAFFIFHKW